ncbi:hypothetical protein BSZ39_08650 [Bowdeniella nasicola]|uniref:Nuclease SbcCD subunit C n=1 Tax=Bowdeniella nasicola TaxID=208480 RepID=A0A1Q5Q178_9ACTO|nr:SMC family ATPase [Bowdeniella nasicola]OKL53614.1 hypothetical protein BSZ39_08650 [Bowdeniella nasicola]
MRLHRLEFDAIGPFPDRHVVDFDDLASSGLFLLSGPTGSGKSTIIDAIVFALYGTTSGQSSGDKATKERLHCTAAPEREPWVELTFSNGSGIYRIRRTPEHQAPKRRGAGTTTRNATCKLFRLATLEEARDPDAGEVLATQVSEAATEIPRIVGLSREQFTQTMVLPQGQFSRFLTAPPEDRTAILRGLFGTQLYERLQEALRERSLKAERSVASRAERAANALEQVIHQLAQVPPALGADEAKHTLPADLRERLENVSAVELLTDEDLHKAVTTEAGVVKDLSEELRTECERVAEAFARVSATRDRLADIARRQARVAQARADREELSAQAEKIAAVRERLARHDRCEALVRSGQELSASVASVNPALAQLLDSELQLPIDLDELLTGSAGAQALAELGELESRLEKDGAELDRDDGRLEKLQLQARRRDALDAQQSELATQQERETARLCELRTETARASEEQARMRETHASASALAAGVDEATERWHDTKDRLAAAREHESLTAKNAELTAALDELAQASQRATQHADALQKRRNSQLAGDLAADLVPDEPCPVCGSREHPAPAELGADHVSEHDLEAALKDASAAQQKAVLARAEHRQLGEGLGETRQRSGGLSVAEAEAAHREVEEALAAAKAARTQAAQAGTLLEELAAKLAGWAKESAALETSLRDAAAAQEKTSAERDSVAADLTEALGEHESVEALEASIARARAANRSAAREASIAEREVRTISRDVETLREQLEAREFATYAEAAGCVLPTETLASLQEGVRDYDTRLIEVDAVLRDQDNQAAAKAEPVELSTIEQDVANHRARHEAVTTLAAAAGTWASSIEQTLARAEQERASYDALASGAATEIRLGRLASGANDRSLTLATFVALDMFESVLVATNARLLAISSGRYELVRTDERERGRQRKLGLSLAVVDHSRGTRRSLHSLSGGETFYTALSLALGLADTVRETHGGIEMNTLFIDEGFGSLDSGTLEQVMDVLHALHDSGRAVGVVSHVDEMKQQIADRIEVRKREDATSTLTVYAAG